MTIDYTTAVEDFQVARRRAVLEQLLARLTGKSAELLSYSQVRDQLKPTNQAQRGLEEIPLDAIVGSVNRFSDYTRQFRPLRDADRARWSQVKSAMLSMVGVPPIEVYRVGGTYFVKDGNHRVSIARDLGLQTISAYVTEVKTRVTLSADDKPDTIIAKAQYAEFLEQTNLDRMRPGADLFMTVPGHYGVILEHIQVHHYYIHIDLQRDYVPYPDAVVSWYDNVYLPLVALIREQGLPRHFPAYSEADLYVLVSRYYGELEQELGWRVNPETVIAAFQRERGRGPAQLIERLGEQMRDPLRTAEPSSPETQRPRRTGSRLFRDILMAGAGVTAELPVLEHALALARREQGRLFGLHVVSQPAERESPVVARMSATFLERCQAAGIDAQVTTAVNNSPADEIARRAAWVDLVVLRVARGDAAQTAGLEAIVQRSPRPLLAIPDGAQSSLDRVLLAYDDSDKAREALYVAAYLVGRWGADLVVLTAGPPAFADPVLQAAQTYLEKQGVPARYIGRPLLVADAILDVSQMTERNLLVMGGFGKQPLLRLMLGGAVRSMLQQYPHPLLICR